MSDLQVPVTLGLKDPELLTRQAKAAEQGFKASMGAMKDHAESLGSSITRMAAQAGTALAAMFAVSKFKDMIQGSIEYGASIENMSRKMGLSTNEYQKLSYVAKQSGGDIQNMGRAFSTMSKLAETSNSILGVSTKDSNGHLKDQGKLFEELLIRISEIPNPTERMAASMKVFGMSGREVFNIASQGKDKIHELMEETSKYGLILDKSVINQLHEAEHMQNLLNASWKVAQADITVALVPALNELIPLLVKGAQLIGSFVKITPEQAHREAEADQLIGLNRHLKDTEAELETIKKINATPFSMVPAGVDISAQHIRMLKAEIKSYKDDIQKLAPKAEPSAANQFGDFMDKIKKQKSAKDIGTSESASVTPMDMSLEVRPYDSFVGPMPKTELILQNQKEEAEAKKKTQDDDFKLQEIYNKGMAKDQQSTFAKKLAIMKVEHNQELALFKDTDTRKLSLAKAFSNEETELARKEKEMKIQFGLDYASHTLQMLTTIADASKANAQVKKRLAEGEAIVSGGKAVLGIVENSGQFISAFGPIAGPIAEGVEIGLTVAEVAAQISKIESAKFARGTSFAPGGMALVGEEGPELVNLPRGSQVLTNAQTSNYFNSGGDHIHFHSPQIIIHGNPDQKTIGRMTQAFNEAFTQNTHKAMRTLQTRGKLPGTTIFG